MDPKRIFHSLLFRNLVAFLAILGLVVLPILYWYLSDIEKTLSEKLSAQLELIARQGMSRLNPAEVASIRNRTWADTSIYRNIVAALAGIQRDFSVDNAVVYRKLTVGNFVYVADGNRNFSINQAVALHRMFPETFLAANEAWNTGRPGSTRLFTSGNSKWFQVNVPLHLEEEVVAVLMINKFATPIALEIQQRQYQVLAWSISILLLGLIVRWFLTRRQLRPLLTLQRATRQIARGDLDVDLPETRDRSEIGELARDFHQMVADLKAGRSEIEEHHRTLEQRIEQRTREIRDLMLAQVRQAERLEAIGSLSGGIAHDFNNILTPILGYTEMVMARHGSEEDRNKYLERVLEAAHRARDLIARILHVSRPSGDHRRPTDLAKVVGEVLNLMQATLPRTIEVQRRIETHAGTVNADTAQIYTVLMNLCVNASHAMPDKGKLTVLVEEVELDAHPGPDGPVDGPYVKVEVSDTGTGMGEEVLARIFEPFFTTKGEGMGTGLGLPMVKEIVEDHGGFLQVSSRVGSGTAFTLYFPAATDLPEASVPTGPAAISGEEAILFVEDEASIRLMGRMMLESLGYQVTVAEHPLGALEAYRRETGKFDLVIADQSSPQMSGSTLAEEFHRIAPSLPYILTTGLPEPDTAEKLRPGPVNYILPKPYTRDSIGHAVRTVLDQGD